MRGYIIKRLLLGIPTILGAMLLIFTIMRVIPGDVAVLIAVGGSEGEEVVAEEIVEKIRVQLGLDRPVYEQFGEWVWQVVTWDLGDSFILRQPVTEMLARKLPMTLQLGLMALLLSWIIAIPIGILSAVKQDTPLDYIPRFISIIGLAIPNFWLGILILTFAAAWFNWFPPIIYQTPWDDPVVNMTQLFFPCLVLGASQAAIQVRMMRTTMLEVLREDYIRTANAKGLKKFSVLWRHAMKNALIPVVTISGSQLANLIGGALVTETVFNLPGIGAATVDAVRLRDYPVIQNFVLIITTGHVLVNLLIDLLYGWLNPRIRYS